MDRRLLRIDHQLGVDRVELIHDRLTAVVREQRDKERVRAARAGVRKRHLIQVLTLIVIGSITSAAWYAWDRVWTNSTMDHLAKAQASSTSEERLSESVKALLASRLSLGVDKSYTGQVANDAIGAVIGEHARNGTLGKLPAYPSVPGIECERVPLFKGADSYSVKITSDFASPAAIDGLEACPIFAANLEGTLLAAAWEKETGANVKVEVKVFRLSPNFYLGSGKNGALVSADLKEDGAPWMKTKRLKLVPLLREESKKRGANPCKDRSLRFSQDDRIVTFECLYSGARSNELEWIPLALEGTSSDPASRVSGNAFEAVQKLAESQEAASVFLDSRSKPKLGFATIRGDGYVQIWREDKDQLSLSAESRSDFVRVATSGRPTALDVQDVRRSSHLRHLRPHSLSRHPSLRAALCQACHAPARALSSSGSGNANRDEVHGQSALPSDPSEEENSGGRA